MGSSKAISARWSNHRLLLADNRNPCRGLQAAWNKYGAESFRFDILSECAVSELEETEQIYVDTLKPELNMLTDVRKRYGAEMLARRAATTRARAALITHCPRGHPYDKGNTYINKKGKRICRACNAIRVAAIYASETPAQTEERLRRYRDYYLAHRVRLLETNRSNAAAHKIEKAAYDRARRDRLKREQAAQGI